MVSRKKNWFLLFRGTPVRGYLNGRFFGSRQAAGPSASTDLSSNGSGSGSGSKFGSGFSGWLGRGRQEPSTSTPRDRRTVHLVEDSFGSVTPIRDSDAAGLLRPRSVLGRPSLASFGRLDGPSSSAPKKGGLFSRFMTSDPIHLTPQPPRDSFTRHSPPHPRPLQFLNTTKEEGNWFSRHSTALLLGLFALFFVGAGSAYVWMKWDPTAVAVGSVVPAVRYQLYGSTSGGFVRIFQTTSSSSLFPLCQLLIFSFKKKLSSNFEFFSSWRCQLSLKTNANFHSRPTPFFKLPFLLRIFDWYWWDFSNLPL